MHRYRRHPFRSGRRKNPLIGAVWLIGMGLLILTKHIWPGILVLIGITIILSSFSKNSEDIPEFRNSNLPGIDPFTEHQPSMPVIITKTDKKPAEQTDVRPGLPSNCSKCGAPVIADDVKWKDSKSAACPYCGSTLVNG
ncbi:MAG: hypothetical protein WCP19_00940 [Chloroflexota bacterium]